ncbi:MAG: single-stranded-DNA-specific exonuclease RecJ, partial [Minisyncoccia bacterium]
MSKKYLLREPIPEKIDKMFESYSPLVRQLLYSRGIEDLESAESFLNPKYESLYDPFLLKDMDKAVKRILKAIKKDEKIAIFSDYDADGIPGGVALHDFFKKIG